jgi:CBS domain-containing protein
VKGKGDMSVYEHCQRDVATAGPDASVRRVALLMEERAVGIVVIVEERRPIGIVTDHDLVVRVLNRELDPGATSVRDVMTEDPIVLDASTGLYEAMKCGRDWGIQRLPIVDAAGNLVGIISLDDIIRLLVEEITWVANIVEKVSTAVTV